LGGLAREICRLEQQFQWYILKTVPDDFRWIPWNLDKIDLHGCGRHEVEHLVRNPGRGWPRKGLDGRFSVQGRGAGDRMIQVVYVLDRDGTAFVIHAMPLTTRRRRGGR
jgi:hypothetical protein